MGSQLFLYILKRLLVMIPTLLAIALVCFVVLNLAPGRPGQAGDAAQAAGSEEAREQQRLFREQFNYDRPVLWNLYFNVTKEEVRDKLELSADPDAPQKEKLDAQYDLEDWGTYVVPELIEIMNNIEFEPRNEARLNEAQLEDYLAEKDLLRRVLYQLSINGRMRNLFLGRESDVPEDLQDKQREVGLHNKQLSRWKPAENTTAEKLIELKGQWNEWYEEHEERFALDTSEKISLFFTDTRFYKYMGNLLTGDFGFTIKKEPVLPEVLKRLKYSFILSFVSIILVYLLSIPLGIFSAIKQHTLTDQIVTVTLFILYSLPTFFVGTLIVQWFPSGEPFFTSGFETSTVANPYLTTGERLWDIVLHLVLPILTMTYGGLATLSRYARSGLLDVIRADYIRTARAKGLAESVVIMKHAVRNGMIPILTLLGTLLPILFSGSIVVEYIFEIDGIGRYLLQAIALRDYSVIMGILLISAVMTLFGLLVSDISYAMVDPRITFD